MRSFGCLCYPTKPVVHRDKFEPRTTPHIFVGYPFGTKGYKVLSLATRKICVSRDVVFYETIFPFVSSPKGVFFDSTSKPSHDVLSNTINHDFGYDDTSVYILVSS